MPDKETEQQPDSVPTAEELKLKLEKIELEKRNLAAELEKQKEQYKIISELNTLYKRNIDNEIPPEELERQQHEQKIKDLRNKLTKYIQK